MKGSQSQGIPRSKIRHNSVIAFVALHMTYLTPVLALFLLVGLWELTGAWSKVPSAPAVVRALKSLVVGGPIPNDLMASSARWFQGFIWGSTLGLALGIATGLMRGPGWAIGGRTLQQLLHFLRSIPVIGLPAVLMLIAGVDEWGKIFIIAWGSLFPVWINTHRGIRQIDPEIKYLQPSLQLTGWTAVWRVLVPAVAPSAFSGVRISLGVAWICVVAAEWLGVVEHGWLGYGLGLRLWREQSFNHLSACLAILFVFGVLGLLTDGALVLTMRLLSWLLDIRLEAR